MTRHVEANFLIAAELRSDAMLHLRVLLEFGAHDATGSELGRARNLADAR